LAKNGSFGFAKGRLACRAKLNVPFVRLAKIVFKKCVVGKNKKYRSVGFWVGCLNFHFFCPYFLFHSVVHFYSVRSLGLQVTVSVYEKLGYTE